jgi:hypothetical protein
MDIYIIDVTEMHHYVDDKRCINTYDNMAILIITMIRRRIVMMEEVFK